MKTKYDANITANAVLKSTGPQTTMPSTTTKHDASRLKGVTPASDEQAIVTLRIISIGSILKEDVLNLKSGQRHSSIFPASQFIAYGLDVQKATILYSFRQNGQ